MDKTILKGSLIGNVTMVLLFVALGMAATAGPAAGPVKGKDARTSNAKADPRIESVRGKATLKEIGATKPHSLSAKDRNYPLLPGDEVRCDRGKLILMIHGHRLVRTSAQGWYPIPTPPSNTRLTADLKSFFNVAGRPRGGVTIYSPPFEGGAVWPERVVLRWDPTTRRRSADAILTANDRQIWSAEKIDTAGGKLDSSAVRKALCALRDEHPDVEVTLHLHITESAEGPDLIYSATFEMLSKDNARSLQAELQQADGAENTLIRCVLRANAFSRRRLYSEAADEYVKAVAAYPERHDVREAAYNALLRTGNLAAATKIERR